MDSVNELIQFLAPDEKEELKSTACETAAQLTGTPEGLNLLIARADFLTALLRLVRIAEMNTNKNGMRGLVNISAEEAGARALLSLQEIHVTAEMVELVVDKEFPHADYACAVLANLTKHAHLCQKVYDIIAAGPTKLEGLVDILCQLDYNKKGASLHLLASVISNFSQLSIGRRQMMDKIGFVLQRLMSFMDYKESIGRRMAVIAAIHNCCFEKEYHPWLMGEDVDLVPRLLLPLAGPDTFTEEENESLPIDLQYLPDDKEREPDQKIRRLLLESLMQLCITREGREIMRKQNVYLILREHHKWEEKRHCIMLNEDIVNLLIRTEGEIGVDDLSSVEIPPDMASKFADHDKEFLTESSSDMNSLTEEAVEVLK
nr:protein HGH1 homolog isoform X1 [Procambarus clarkii]XP_045599284.1 protein HGH1 homolog isoform X1 [Procambarus clarkii]